MSDDDTAALDKVWTDLDAKWRAVESAAEAMLKKYDKNQKLRAPLLTALRHANFEHELDADASCRRRALQQQDHRHRLLNDASENALTWAARAVRLETLNRRNVGYRVAIEQASQVDFCSLSPAEQRQAREAAFHFVNDPFAPAVSRPPSELPSIAIKLSDAIKAVTRRKVGFGRYRPGTTRNASKRGRPTGPAFRLLLAALDYFGYAAAPDTVADILRGRHPQQRA